MSQRLIALATSALLIGGLFVGAPARVRADTDTVYVADVASAGVGGSCSAPDYATGNFDHDVAIQAAINEVDLDATLTTVYLCDGTYNITTTLEPSADIILKGANAATTILDGGAIYIVDHWLSGGVSIIFSLSSVTVEGLTFRRGANLSVRVEGDRKTWGGGAINAHLVTVIDSTFTQNKASDGGAIWTFGPSTIEGDSVFTGNTALYGGAIFHYSGEDLTIQGSSEFAANQANTGGAIYSWGHTLVTNGTFSDNASECNGGAIVVNSDVTVASSTFTDNVTDCNGGAIFAETATIARSRFTRNMAVEHGGAVYVDEVTADNFSQLRRNTFTGNRADSGGAITLRSCDVITRSQATRVEQANRFLGNRATEQRRTRNVERWLVGCS